MSDAAQQIKDRLNIIDVVSPYVELHKAGKNFKGKSPFTSEKTPSFYVSPDRGMYYCFSTSQGGDIFNFIQVMEGVDFKEALKILAQKAGVDLVPEDPKHKSEREHLYAALEAATIFYQDVLPKEQEAVTYLKKRGVKDETIAKWRIGFAPGPPKAGWRETKEALEAQNFTKETLSKVGLIKSAEGGKEPFDVFRDRIMFPMAEPNGKVVAFSGRILHPNEKAPKYVNSPETPLYKKSELLFGYDKAKTGIRNLDFSLIVEGQFDVVMCHQAGYGNAVAVSGTALTLYHVQLLERLSEKVVLALDADRAGINAMKKAADLMLRRGLDVKVAELPLGNDPADIISENPTEFKKVIGGSVHVIEFLLHVLRREITDDRSFKLKVGSEVLPFILLLPSRIDQEHFTMKVADAIGTTVDAIRFELDRVREQAAAATTRVSVRTSDTGVYQSSQVTSDLSQKSYVYLTAAIELLESDFAEKVRKSVNDIKTIGEVIEPDESDRSGVLFALEQQFASLPKQALEEEIVAKLNQFKTALIRKRLAECRRELAAAEQAHDEARFAQVFEEISRFETKRREAAYETKNFQ